MRSKILKKQWMLLFETLRAITGFLITRRAKQPFSKVSKKTFSLSSTDKFLYSVARVVIRGQSSTTSYSLIGVDVLGAF